MAIEAPPGGVRASPPIPLTRWADRKLTEFAAETASAPLSATTLLGERAALGGYAIPGTVSAGTGGGRLLRARDGWFALTLTRPDDRELLPALFGDASMDVHDDSAIAAAVAVSDKAALLAQGRALGLAVALPDEGPASPAISQLTSGAHRQRPAGHVPLVIDLTAIWAGPLAGHLLWHAGARVVKVENPMRPDRMRDAEPAFYAMVNQGKASVAANVYQAEDREALVALLRRADMVIEAARPRALLQIGIDADVLVREVPGLVWLSITGHGARGEPANWIGIGHDCGVAGGLSQALEEASGRIGFVGDALPDPLTGITAALEGWRAWRAGVACRIGLSLSGVARLALDEERAHDTALLQSELRAWRDAEGLPFPAVAMREMRGEVRSFGADTTAWLGPDPPC